VAEQWLARLGAGVLLGWLALPLLFALARQSRALRPAVYHRALCLALLLALGLLAAPCSRPLLEAHFAATPARVLFSEDAVQVLREWATPLIAAPRETWTDGIFRRLASGLALV